LCDAQCKTACELRPKGEGINTKQLMCRSTLVLMYFNGKDDGVGRRI